MRARRAAAQEAERARTRGSRQRSAIAFSDTREVADRRRRRGGPRGCARRRARDPRARDRPPAARPPSVDRAARRARAGRDSSVGQRALAVAGDAGDADDLAGAARSRLDVVERACPRPRARRASSAQHDRARRRAAASRAASAHRAADHQLGELAPCVVAARGARRRPAGRRAAPRCGRQTASTSSSLWLMKMIDRPSATSCAQRREQRLGLLRRQHGGRLVEDQDARVAVERLQDLDALPLADRQRRRPRASGSTARPKRRASLAQPRRAPRAGARRGATAARCRA